MAYRRRIPPSVKRGESTQKMRVEEGCARRGVRGARERVRHTVSALPRGLSLRHNSAVGRAPSVRRQHHQRAVDETGLALR